MLTYVSLQYGRISPSVFIIAPTALSVWTSNRPKKKTPLSCRKMQWVLCHLRGRRGHVNQNPFPACNRRCNSPEAPMQCRTFCWHVKKMLKSLTDSVLTTKPVWLLSEYMGTRKTRVMLDGVPMDLTVERLGVFFKFCSDYMWITMSRKKFMDILDKLFCYGRNILGIVEGRRLHCWSRSAAGHLSNPASKPATPAAPKPAACKEAVGTEKSGQTPSGFSVWTDCKEG